MSPKPTVPLFLIVAQDCWRRREIDLTAGGRYTTSARRWFTLASAPTVGVRKQELRRSSSVAYSATAGKPQHNQIVWLRSYIVGGEQTPI